jgi:class 3 adenylate cyclase
MQQIADWLDKLGMSEYAQRFAENDIDFTILSDLTDHDLEKIGVASLGHRRKLLRAIAELDGRPTATSPSLPPLGVTPAPTPASAPPPISTPVETTGERRHVAVMFCDLVDSTGIAAKLDAEKWRDLVGAYLDAASAAVVEIGGKVAKKLGDGLMDTVRLSHSAGERRGTCSACSSRDTTIVGRAEPQEHRQASARRTHRHRHGAGGGRCGGRNFRRCAEHRGVVVTARVQRQIAGLFVVEERGSHELKGVPEPVTLYRIVRASGAGRRAGQRHLTPLVGRDEEIALLMRRWDRARQGDGQLVLIVGEPALGTSKRSNAPSHVSQWMTGPMLRKLFNISAVTLWRWRRRSGFPRGKSINGRLYIPWHEVEAWLQSQPEAA